MIIDSLWKRVRRLAGWQRPRPTILMYHRVAEHPRDPWELIVPPSLFEEQMAYLRRHRTVFSMERLVELLQQDALPQRAVAVTFDDGYRDNLVHARPSLERHGIPSTMFVATGLVGSQQGMWWDELAAMILEAPDPADVALVLGEAHLRLQWQLPEAADYNPIWRGWEPPTTARQRCFQQVWRTLKSVQPGMRAAAMERMRRELPITQNSLALPMSAAELQDMQAGGLCTLGAHTVSHASLPLVNESERRKEIRDSRAACAFLSTKPVHGFAYPYGDVDTDTVRDVQEAGFSWACSTRVTFVDAEQPTERSSEKFYILPRISAATNSLSSFIEKLTG